MDKKIFISYIEEDREVAELIAQKLSEEGFSPWAYTVNGSTNWKKQVVRELNQCEIMILIFSKKTNEKADKQIVKELGLASEYEKEIIPFMIDEISPKDITNEAILYEIVGGNITWLSKEQPIEKQVRKLIYRVKEFYDYESNNLSIDETIYNTQPYLKNKKILFLPIILFLTWLFLFNKPLHEERIPMSNNDDPYSLEYIIAGTRDINGKWNAWTKEKLTIKDNDEFLYFNLHYYPNKEKFKNARIGMDMVPNNLEASSPILVNYFFTADNTKPTHSYYQIESLDTIELTPVSLSWQEKKCQSRTCESNLLGYNSEQEKLNDLFTRGINLGDIDANKYGNLVVKFHIRHKKQPKSLTTNQSPLNLPTLSATNKRGSSKRWFQSIHIDSSEILSFELHYYTGYVGAKNLRASIDNLNGKFFKEDEKIIVRGKISADNLDTSYGQVTVIFDENVSLKLHRISWQKTGCQSVECEMGLSANYNDLFKKNGLLLGDVPKDDDSYYYGNLIVEYKIMDIRKDSKTDTSSKKYTTKENFNFTTNEDPNHIPTLSVTNKNGFDWLDDIDVNIGDHLAFQIHYYGWHFGMKNPKVFINTLDNMEFKKGDTIEVYARVMADNLKAAEGFVKVTFNENIKLILDHISLQENRCRSFKCESEIKGDKLKIFSKEGLELRDIPMKNNNDYFGNIVVRYKVVKPDAS